MKNKRPYATSLFVALAVAATVAADGASLGKGPPQWAAVNRGNLAARQIGADLPLYFIENRGQLDPQVRFYLPGSEKQIFFTPSGITFELVRPVDRRGAPDDEVTSTDADSGVFERWAVKLDFVESRRHVRLSRAGSPAGVFSYFQAGPKSQAAAPAYTAIRYRELWPGVDLLLAGDIHALKYEYRVRAGADPARIRFAYRGADVGIGDDGRLEVTTPLGGFVDESPYAYQEIEGRRVEVAAAYDRIGAQENQAPVYGFQLGTYDPRYPLVIDPAVLIYAGFIGGAAQDEAYGIDIDEEGNAYVVGTAHSAATTFPVTAGPQTAFNGASDVFVAKVNPSGNSLVYAGYIGGSSFDHGEDIAVDAQGNAYITGRTQSADFPTTAGPPHSGRDDAFVAKVSAGGTRIIYSRLIGGMQIDEGFGIDVDTSGNTYVVGRTQSSQTSFPVTGGPDVTFNGGNSDGFIAKVSPNGENLIYAGYIGGDDFDQAMDVAVDDQQNAYITGYTKSNQDSFPVVEGPRVRFSGSEDAFVAKLRPDGQQFVYSGYFGGQLGDRGHGIAIDSSGNVYVVGLTSSPPGMNIPITVGPSLKFGGQIDAFIAKFGPGGREIFYAGYIGGVGDDRANAVAVDALGNVYVAGTTLSDQESFPVKVGPRVIYEGGREAFVAKVDTSGAGLDFAGYIGGIADERARGIAVDANGIAYVAGGSTSMDDEFPVGGPDTSFNGIADAFVARVAGTILFPDGIVNGASFRPGPVAPGEIVSIFGSGIGPGTAVGARLDNSGRVATNIGGARVLFDGVPAPLFFARGDQINAQAPYSLDGKAQAQVQVFFQDRGSEEINISVAPSAPGIFAFPDNPRRAIALNQNGSLNSGGNPARPGEVVVLFATGEGQTDPAGVDGRLAPRVMPPEPRLPVSLTIGNLPADVRFSGSAPDFAGLMQVNAVVPAGINGAVEVILTVGNARSQPDLTVSVR